MSRSAYIVWCAIAWVKFACYLVELGTIDNKEATTGLPIQDETHILVLDI